MIVISQTIGIIILGLLALAVLISGGWCLWSYASGPDNHNPNAKHYCANCRKLEWECDCPDC